ncbi:MAG: ATP-binding protein [Bacteroidia bacterium]|nr:ATP-binding protein [Bacteroidia bacterium]
MKRYHTRYVRRRKKADVHATPGSGERLETLQADCAHLRLVVESLQMKLISTDALAALGQLTAGIAHEIRNPINFVNNFAEGLVDLAGELREEIEGMSVAADASRAAVSLLLEEMITSAQKIREHGGRVESIVRSMLLQARGQQGVKEQVELNAFLEQYVSLAFHGMRAQVQDFSVRIERSYDPHVGSISLSRQGMARVFINLLNNAFQAVEEKKKTAGEAYEPVVRVGTLKTENGCSISIEDNGPGVPLHLREKIFEPFFSTKDAASGTGLGLPLSHTIIVDDHNGALTCEESRFGGALFRVALPDDGRE